ncbi:polysaccharide deacetylase [Desulforamulus reducens MI-1]|uniref:Polysaccharide deacetylase n=1 Tax=Desulforamulus reducens (strain ATCC BAA-1160 / DSM 100696 / MI-1) TaxID=349161 RepID=A4J900_DESRM|nr:polysaccharide deacetylase family protein [Desulforamulus reducens]ABO51553.1 polysaccharide deacetylase [Desulforamulus reducens MI-1]
MVIYLGKSTINYLICGLLLMALLVGAVSYSTLTASKGVSVEQWLRDGQVIKQVSTSKKVVALTFDDGPSELYTSRILDVLKQNETRATFFVVGKRAEKYPAVIKRMVTDGHEVANHTYTHPLSPVKSAKLTRELDKTDDIVYGIIGRHTQYYRPPGGKCTHSMIDPAVDKGYKVILWTNREDPKDLSDPGVPQIVSQVVDYVRNGSIIILHDCGGDRSQTVEALPQIIQGVQEKGYVFVTVSELLRDSNTVPAIEEFRMENWVE